METGEYIILTDFCKVHHLMTEFMLELHDNGLIEITVLENEYYIPTRELSKTEKIIRLYSELGINLEGIAVITQLLERIQRMQEEITALKNKLRVYG